jgi:flagellar motility protein MotE (MotC chaperone)
MGAKSVNKRKYISGKLFAVLSLLFTMSLYAFLYLDDLDEFLAKVDISFFPRAKAEASATTSATGKSTEAVAKSAEVGKKEESAMSEEKGEQRNFSETELNHFARLSERKNELDLREKEIQKMEDEIAKQKEDLEKKMVELEDMRKKISSVLEEKVQADDKRIENLVQFYSSMKPQQAAKVIENLDEGLAVEVLARMKKKAAADIMNLLKAEKAQVISEKYAGYRK